MLVTPRSAFTSVHSPASVHMFRPSISAGSPFTITGGTWSPFTRLAPRIMTFLRGKMSELKKVSRCVWMSAWPRVHAGGLWVTDNLSDGASDDTNSVKHESFLWVHQWMVRGWLSACVHSLGDMHVFVLTQPYNTCHPSFHVSQGLPWLLQTHCCLFFKKDSGKMSEIGWITHLFCFAVLFNHVWHSKESYEWLTDERSIKWVNLGYTEQFLIKWGKQENPLIRLT